MKRVSVWVIAFVLILMFSSCIPSNLAPILLKIGGLEGVIQVSTNSLEWIGTDTDGSIAKYEYRKDEGAWTNHSLNTSYTWNGYTEGAHTFEVRAQDNEGAYSNIIIWNFTYNKANQPPVVAKVSGPEGNTDQSNSTFSWSGNDPDGSIAKYEYRKDGGAWTNHALNTSYTWNDYAEGYHSFEVRAQDNEGLYSGVVSWNFSYTNPGVYFYEDFETGDLSANPWVVSGDYLPFVQSSEAYEGNHSLNFLPEFDNENKQVLSTIEVTVTVPTDAYLLFYRKVSGRWLKDTLSLSIDGVGSGSWFSLNTNEGVLHRSDLEWSEVIRRLPAGTHNIKWTYSAYRDSQMDGSDTSWIDRIQIVRNTDLGEVISFPDSRIDQYIRNMIGKAPVEEIRAKEVQDICMVYIEDNTNGKPPLESILEKTPFSVEGFETFYNFEEQMGLPFDLTGLQYCKDLSALVCTGGYVSSVEHLSQSEQLQILGLWPDLASTEALRNLENLFYVSLESGEANLIGLLENRNLKVLAINKLNILPDFSCISNAVNLEQLMVTECGIEDISPLENLLNLFYLGLQKNNITSIEALVNNSGFGAGDLINLQENYLDLTPGSEDMQHIQALQNRGVYVSYDPQKTETEMGAFKVANSWGIGEWENVPDGFLYITYEAMKKNGVLCYITDPKNSYEPKAIAVFEISHPIRDDCQVYVGVGQPALPLREKSFDIYDYHGGPLPFPENKMALDITELLPFNNDTLYLKVFDSSKTSSTGIIKSFSVEVYNNYPSGIPTNVFSSMQTPKNTVNNSSVNVLIPGVVYASSPFYVFQYVGGAGISPELLAGLKEQLGIYEEGVNYNEIIDGFGTGLRPPTEEEWEDIRINWREAKGFTIQDALPVMIDHSTSIYFPPIGNQGSEGSCAAFSIGYYISTFYEARDRGWNLSGAQWVGDREGSPTTSYQNRIFSPDFIYHLINNGVDKGGSFANAMKVISNIGISSWKEMPYSTSDHTSWPSEPAWREAPRYRSHSSVMEVLQTTSDEDVLTLKSYIDSGYLISIFIDAKKYPSLTSNDVWNTDNYTYSELNHANTIVGYDDSMYGDL